MKNTVPTILNNLFLLVFIALLLVGCQSKKTKSTTLSETKTENEPSVKTPQNSQPKKQKWITLTDDNLEQVLTEYGKENPETLVKMITPKGTMIIKLYENTPLHRANFIRLIKNNFYKNTEFYRVRKDFMIQGGDNDDWARKPLKEKMGKYTLPAEFRKDNIHQKGALSMAREYKDNPDKRSVSFEFFIVQGTKYTPGEILGTEKSYNIKISPEHKAIYEKVGGCPHLDNEHTVFGQVIEGLDVIDSIAAVKVDQGDWPIERMTIDLQIIK
jgi:peptidyl-prolyl cis-trans isomerase B (cyclophilin B)